MSIPSLVQFAKTASTILRETFAAPATGSYVLRNGGNQVVLRQGGIYPKINLSGYNLSGLDLHGINLSGADLQGANLTNTNLEGANLTGTNFDRAVIDNARFDDAVVTDAHLSEVTYKVPPSGIAMLAVR